MHVLGLATYSEDAGLWCSIGLIKKQKPEMRLHGTGMNGILHT